MTGKTKSALETKVDTIRHHADGAEQDYDVTADTYDGRTVVEIETAWEQFRIHLGPRGGLRRAEYNTTGWGDGELVDECDTKSRAWSDLLTIIGHPHPYED